MKFPILVSIALSIILLVVPAATASLRAKSSAGVVSDDGEVTRGRHRRVIAHVQEVGGVSCYPRPYSSCLLVLLLPLLFVYFSMLAVVTTFHRWFLVDHTSDTAS